jgi:hypothetical protein
MYYCPQSSKPIHRSNSLVFDQVPIQKKTFSGSLFQLISGTKLQKSKNSEDESNSTSSPVKGTEKIEKTGSRNSLRSINLKIPSMKNFKL